ncbi:MAG: MFS transporter [Syntrophaceae bacterium]|nr:MFS transporter [Syntrophaceae bacterium]
MESTSRHQRARFYYGWVIVGLSLISIAFWYGVRNGFSVFFVALTDHFQWSRAEAAGAYSIAMLSYTVMAPVIGTLVDRIGPRKIILPGIILTGLGLLLCTQTQTLIQFYLFFGVIVGMGVTCLSIAPFTVILAHWFERKRGTANGFAGMGVGIGVLILVPLAQYLISFWGWRSAYLILGLLTLTVPLTLNGLFLRHRPQDIGLLPDGDLPAEDPEGSAHLKEKDMTLYDPSPTHTQEDGALKEIIKTSRFWYVILFPCLGVSGIYIILVHHVRYLVDLGVDKLWAASLFAFIGALSACFKPIWGWFSDRVGREIAYTLGVASFCSGIVFLILFQSVPSKALLYLFAVFFGVGWGVTTPLIMSIAGDIYKGKKFGLIYGMVEGAIGIGGALGAWLAGYIFDQTQNYFWAFVLVILLNLVSALLVWLAAPPRSQRPRTLPI